MRLKYEAINKEGKVIKGELDAALESDAYRLLVSQGMQPVEIKALSSTGAVASGKRQVRFSRSPSTRDKAVVVRELATLLGAGVPLAEAVQSMADAHAEDFFGDIFKAMHTRLRAGDALSVAMASVKLELPGYLYQLVAAGELTGRLAASLTAAANQMEYEEGLRQEIRNALIYPAVLVFSGIAATLLIFIIVVPKFAGMLRNTKADIPEISLWVLKAGLFVKTNLSWVGLLAAVLFFAGWVALSSPERRRKLFEFAAGLPLMGGWLVDGEIGRWSSMLGVLLENRVPIVRAMELAESGVALSSLRHKLELAVRDLRAGKKLADALASHQAVNPMGLNLIRVGELSGELPAMLRTLAGLYETSSRARMKRFVILLEPITILVIGAVIGFIMVAIMLAITSMSNFAR